MLSDGEIAAVPLTNDSICRDNRQRFRRLFHWGPIIALFIIFYVAFFALRCSIYLSPPTQSLPGCFQFTFISFMLYRILHSYFNATFLGPGFVPLTWKPSDAKAEGKLQYCQNCKGFKPPRSHHCRSCRRCVFKMDHHCPWINTCCGHLNHGHFTWFLLSVPVGCTTSAIVLGRHVYNMWFNLPYLFVRPQFTSLIQIFTEMFLVMFAFGLAVGVTLAVGGLGLYQLYYIQKNQTGIESWIVAKANHWRKEAGLQPFQYPYDLGRWNNLAQLGRHGSILAPYASFGLQVRRNNSPSIDEPITLHNLRWFGHVLRMPVDRLPRRAFFAQPREEWIRARGGQTMTGQRSMKAITSKLSCAGHCRLPGWAPRDRPYQWLETLLDMAQSHPQWC
ncbi:hypothetical protein T265_08181 [Opisthorchis viverrini]|uniref:Palmitoyltransferase n=1 Tax=Opisthorchis viverrini TaxID=6198 RepID=A0A074ZEJ9_OPIVI|nr:hypothetical protein T265_08181 [Opisthorchis viverrini]KER24092.1 hypothetical protein T265_08181 [Opisthorchis viverrini]